MSITTIRKTKRGADLGTSDGFVLEGFEGVWFGADIDASTSTSTSPGGGSGGVGVVGVCGEVWALGEEGGGVLVCGDEEVVGSGGEEGEVCVFCELLLVLDRDSGAGVVSGVEVAAGLFCGDPHECEDDGERDQHPESEFGGRCRSEHQIGCHNVGGVGVWCHSSRVIAVVSLRWCRWCGTGSKGGSESWWLGLVGFDDGGDPDGVFVIDKDNFALG